MKKILVLIAVVLGLAVLAPAGAQTSNSAPNLGTSWLKISPSTRNVAMGDSSAALPDAFDQIDLNPAGLGLIGGTFITLSQDFWAQSLSVEHLVFTRGTAAGDGFALGANFMNFGSIDTYNVTGGGSVLTSTGSYSPIGLNAYGAYGLSLSGGLRAGLTAHFIYDNVQQNVSSTTGSIDAGLYYQMPGSPFSMSEVLTNIGWDIDSSTLPMQVKTAAAYRVFLGADGRMPHYLTLTGEADWFLNGFSYTQYGVGMEYWYKNLVAIRAGYQFSNIGDLTGLVGLSLGAGIRYQDWRLDYAFVSLGELGIANQIGLSLKLGSLPKPTPAPTPIPMVTPVVAAAAPPPAPPMPLATPTFMEMYRSGIQKYEAKDFAASIRDLKDALLIQDNTVPRYFYAEANAMLGVIYKFNLPDPLLSHQYCDLALMIDPSTETARKLRYEIDASNTKTEKKYWDGMELYGKGKYDDAMDTLKAVVHAHDRTTPSFFYAEAYKTLGFIYEFYKGDQKLALECYKAALKIEPKDIVAQQSIDKLSTQLQKP
jgi:tetratricopeptide (TPR) repeat protein